MKELLNWQILSFIPKKLDLSHDVMLNNVKALDIFFTNFSDLKTISTKPLKFKENEGQGLVGKKFILNNLTDVIEYENGGKKK